MAIEKEIQEFDGTPTIFISHKLEDGPIAQVLAKGLEDFSEGLEIFVAGNSEFRTAAFGKYIAEDVAKNLDRSELILLVFTGEDKDWSWCLWESGVATDPKDLDRTKTIVISFTGNAPDIFAGRLHVQVNDRESIRDFAEQLCLKEEFFPMLGKPLTTRDKNWVKETADRLFDNLAEFRIPKPRKEINRLGGFRIHLAHDAVKSILHCIEQECEPDADDITKFIGDAVIIDHDDWAMRQFHFAPDDEKITLSDVRNCWNNARHAHERSVTNNRNWDEIIFDEIMRICARRPPNRTWDPFLGLDEGKWLYPIVTRWFINPDKSREFDIALLQTREPGEKFPGE